MLSFEQETPFSDYEGAGDFIQRSSSVPSATIVKAEQYDGHLEAELSEEKPARSRGKLTLDHFPSGEREGLNFAANVYRCLLSKMNAFPSADEDFTLAMDAYDEGGREKYLPAEATSKHVRYVSRLIRHLSISADIHLLRPPIQIQMRGAQLRGDVKKIARVVADRHYGFQQRPNPDQVQRNRDRYALLMKGDTFVFRVSRLQLVDIDHLHCMSRGH
jgi:hypothetical protein